MFGAIFGAINGILSQLIQIANQLKLLILAVVGVVGAYYLLTAII